MRKHCHLLLGLVFLPACHHETGFSLPLGEYGGTLVHESVSDANGLDVCLASLSSIRTLGSVDGIYKVRSSNAPYVFTPSNTAEGLQWLEGLEAQEDGCTKTYQVHWQWRADGSIAQTVTKSPAADCNGSIGNTKCVYGGKYEPFTVPSNLTNVPRDKYVGAAEFLPAQSSAALCDANNMPSPCCEVLHAVDVVFDKKGATYSAVSARTGGELPTAATADVLTWQEVVSVPGVVVGQDCNYTLTGDQSLAAQGNYTVSNTYAPTPECPSGAPTLRCGYRASLIQYNAAP